MDIVFFSTIQSAGNGAIKIDGAAGNIHSRRLHLNLLFKQQSAYSHFWVTKKLERKFKTQFDFIIMKYSWLLSIDLFPFFYRPKPLALFFCQLFSHFLPKSADWRDPFHIASQFLAHLPPLPSPKSKGRIIFFPPLHFYLPSFLNSIRNIPSPLKSIILHYLLI